MMVLKWSCKFLVFFCRFAIDTMQSVCLDEFGGEKAVHPSSQETTIIQHIFGGQLQSQVMHLLVKCFTSCFQICVFCTCNAKLLTIACTYTGSYG